MIQTKLLLLRHVLLHGPIPPSSGHLAPLVLTLSTHLSAIAVPYFRWGSPISRRQFVIYHTSVSIGPTSVKLSPARFPCPPVTNPLSSLFCSSLSVTLYTRCQIPACLTTHLPPSSCLSDCPPVCYRTLACLTTACLAPACRYPLSQ